MQGKGAASLAMHNAADVFPRRRVRLRPLSIRNVKDNQNSRVPLSSSLSFGRGWLGPDEKRLQAFQRFDYAV